MDKILFDYDHRPLQSEYGNIGDYIEAMVRTVKERAERCGLGGAKFEFRMDPGLWEGVSAFYACKIGADGRQVSTADIALRRASIEKRQTIVVDGTEYAVSLEPGVPGSILFSVSAPKAPGLNAEIKSVGEGANGTDIRE